jgi:hypothetical protein
MLDLLDIIKDFNTFCGVTGLAEFSREPKETYVN